ncbi:hypothetical protein BH11PSE7_BH11PSE7_29940 [soil metagenome]
MDTNHVAVAARAEGARYALLRRLAPAMRHHLVVNLQPIGMIYEVLERRLQSPTPDLRQVRDSAVRINGFTRAAVRSCLDVITWLSPEEGATSTIAEGVDECLGLLNGNLNFRGFTITNDVPGEGSAAGDTVARSAIRSVLTAALLACTDAVAEPADLVLAAWVSGDRLVVSIELTGAPGRSSFSNEAPYRLLRWDDVLAISEAEGALVTHSHERVELSFARVTPTVPLTTD